MADPKHAQIRSLFDRALRQVRREQLDAAREKPANGGFGESRQAASGLFR